eukprot:Seg1106.3 transcript_id=Seg1106.3/GoldUCD/mRNA.D3Y31 product="hypothetical protein" protein_id=Seg1106.3/GoldUCD/D3Y31
MEKNQRFAPVDQCSPKQLAIIDASNWKDENIRRLARKLQRKGLALFKVAPQASGTQHPHACSTSHIRTYMRRCPLVKKTTNEYDRMPRFLTTAECAPNCDPKCCAVTYSVQVLKKQKNKFEKKLDVWVMQQEEIVLDYIRP